MTINLTDPDNHPANGPLTVERIARLIAELQHSLSYQNGGDMAYVIADAIKGLEELLVSREADPVCFIGERMLDELSDGARSCGRVWSNVRDELSGEGRIPLYIAPPGPQSSKMSGIMPDYEGVAMTQRECYIAGKEAGLAEARKFTVIANGCMWTYCEHDYYWESSCGESWTFIEDGPEENGVKFCHGCGRPVLITASPQEVES